VQRFDAVAISDFYSSFQIMQQVVSHGTVPKPAWLFCLERSTVDMGFSNRSTNRRKRIENGEADLAFVDHLPAFIWWDAVATVEIANIHDDLCLSLTGFLAIAALRHCADGQLAK